MRMYVQGRVRNQKLGPTERKGDREIYRQKPVHQSYLVTTKTQDLRGKGRTTERMSD